ncbi:MAG: hypothetical protein KatS3mg050_0475 [Litorilinea sp.]|nr:MAG: hypothetical protein KatS3mg050_0475 [Litorilinea sp.]
MRFAVVRRLYFYGIALISFIVGFIALDNLVRTLVELWLDVPALYEINRDRYLVDTVARQGGLLLVATPIFVLHWRYIQSRLVTKEERQAGLRKFFLYAASAVAVGFVLVRAYDLLRGIALLALGAGLADIEIWPSLWLHRLLMVVLGSAVQAALHGVLVADGDYGQESGNAALWRQVYQVLAGLVGLGLVIAGISGILETAWLAVVGRLVPAVEVGWWRSALSDRLAILLLGGLLARVNWRRWQAITATRPAEAQSALRRLYLYGAVVISALATLVPAAGLLRELLLMAFGAGSGTLTELLQELATPVSLIPVGLVAWRWHWRILGQEADRYGESQEAATVRRIYYYAVAATGLGLLWFGAADIIQILLEAVLGTDAGTPGGSFWPEPLANGLSLLAVGAPIWAAHWRAVQGIARRQDRAGLAERSAAPRKVYLYGVALVGALLILFYLAQAVYRLLLWLLGDPEAGFFSATTAEEVARSMLAAILWAVHVMAIRDDGRLGTEGEPEEESPMDRAEILRRQIARLEAELAHARAELEALEQK